MAIGSAGRLFELADGTVNRCLATMSNFTFYADLVGISSLYATSPKQAYEKLNNYYNIVFQGLAAFYFNTPDRKVEMFSDSLVVTGDDVHDFVTAMAPVYMSLLAEGLLLRGGLVDGPLTFDVRITTTNFQKKLPDSDVLARCVAFERKVKGARLVVESSIAEQFLQQYPEWQTLHGYATNRRPGQKEIAIQRALIPLPDGSAYELLYPVVAQKQVRAVEKQMSELDYMILALPSEVANHYTETKRLLAHSKARLEDHHAN
jgi:hypothetical protein